MNDRCLFAVCAASLITQISTAGQISFTEDFATGGQPDLNNWADGDVTDGQTWIIPNDEFGSGGVAARRDSPPVTGAVPVENAGNGGTFGNANGGRLRALQSSTTSMLAAIDLTTAINEAGTLDLINIGDGTGDTTWRLRLKDGGGTTALELVFGNGETSSFWMTGTQTNSGPFITESQNIDWRNPGANVFVTFDVMTDTFSVEVTETSGGNIAGTAGSFAFDNPVTKIARLEFVVDQINTGIGSEVSFESIVLQGTSLELVTAEFTQASTEDTFAMEFLSDVDVIYRLDSTTDLVTSNNFMSTGAFTIGNGTNQFLYDPTQFSTNKAYRIVVNPSEIKPL